jgi:membrane-associated phospholipid phosphatase
MSARAAGRMLAAMSGTSITTSLRARSELGLFLAAYLLYTAGRWLTAAELAPATEHAEWILSAEGDLGLAVERSIQEALAGGPAMWLLSNVYLAAQLAVLPGSLLLLYHRAPAIYRKLRDTVLATWAIAVPIYALFPVAPPRLAGTGLADTVSQQAAVGLTGRSTMFYNELAAVPSLHCGFAVAIGIALAAAATRRPVKLLALAWGPLVCLSVVATGNHYIFDIAAGLAAAVAGYFVGPLPARLLRNRRRAPRPAVLVPIAGTR